jgi:hypothetical protein
MTRKESPRRLVSEMTPLSQGELGVLMGLMKKAYLPSLQMALESVNFNLNLPLAWISDPDSFRVRAQSQEHPDYFRLAPESELLVVGEMDDRPRGLLYKFIADKRHYRLSGFSVGALPGESAPSGWGTFIFKVHYLPGPQLGFRDAGEYHLELSPQLKADFDHQFTEDGTILIEGKRRQLMGFSLEAPLFLEVA